VFVDAEVVDPALFRPRFLGCWLAVEEKDVGFDALGLEDAGRQSRFASAAFEEDVVWNNDRGAAVLLQDCEDVLKEVEL
jgi:hypothetical protein